MSNTIEVPKRTSEGAIMLNVITGLYILSVVAPTLLVILAWSRRPAAR